MRRFHVAAGLVCALVFGPASAKLPTPNAEQQQAAEAKKQAAAQQAAKEKEELAASMERVSGHWRKRAAENGWEVHPQLSPEAAKPGPAPAAPLRSEKAGTAAPSEDIKNPAEKGK